MRFCVAVAERSSIRRMFASAARGWFMTTQHRKSRCTKLMVDGKIVDQLEALLNVRVQHFGKLAKSKVNDSDGSVMYVVGIQYSWTATEV